MARKVPEGAKIIKSDTYKTLQREARKPGVQPSERLAISKLKDKGMTTKEAKQKLSSRLSKGKDVAGIKTHQIVNADGTWGRTIGKKGVKAHRKASRRSPGDYGSRDRNR